MAPADRTPDVPPALRPGHPLAGLGYSEPTRRRSLTQLADGTRTEGEAVVAEEVPVALAYNDRPYAVMMATPADLEDFAVGFTLTEEIVSSAGVIDRLDVTRHAQGVEVSLAIPEADAARLADRHRALIGRVGCGLCGVETIQDAMREPRALPAGPTIPVAALWRAERELPPLQVLNRETGSLHAAAWADASGAVGLVREDVGRHNALDKLLGALVRGGLDPAEGFVVVTSRASYELVQKAAVLGVRVLAAVSRPTGLAIRLAEASGLTLIALLRGRTANVYAHGERLADAAGAATPTERPS
ncbi:MAG TPA: formate dehydrogenase accessory sulfurtransferase FdhD [Gemmatimonadales bacterium]|nr:formate dehydrogenase accessory sulfurtransferase FdhD [Gemmatimonadales bacterium]